MKAYFHKLGVGLLGLLLVLLILAGQNGVVMAQGYLEPGAAQTGYGSKTLLPDFEPDPYIVPMSSGGRVNITTVLGSACRGDAQGYVASAPDFRLELPEELARLRIFFVGDGDTTLVIAGPDEQWVCDDDAGELGQPVITFQGASPGTYNIWVGSYRAGQLINGQLYITAGNALPADFYTVESAAVLKETPAPVEMNSGLAPIHGIESLATGVSGDSFAVPLLTGGPVDLRGWQANCTGEAVGFTTVAPSLMVHYGPTQRQRISFSFLSEGDTTLAIQAPDESWYCNDDAEGTLNPEVVFEPAQSGLYSIWVGSFERATYIEGALVIVDQPQFLSALATAEPSATFLGEATTAPTDTPFDPGSDLNYLSVPTFGEATLVAGFEPDPHQIALSSGGEVALAEVLGTACQGEAAGFAAHAPDYRLKYTGADLVNVARLRLFFAGAGDTTLAVRAPDGRWYCDDDTGGGLQPLVDMVSPLNGTYNIWVGSYERGNVVTGTLTVTELELFP